MKIIIIGATSGIGYEVATQCVKSGWTVGIAGRRDSMLEEMRTKAPDKIMSQALDVTCIDAPDKLQSLVEKIGGEVDIILLSSGIGSQNTSLKPSIELDTVKTNVEGFTRMTNAVFHLFKRQGYGHLAVISSIAGTQGLGVAAAYSASKRFQNTYIDALAQLARMEKLNITFTDIRPGFVATDLLKDGNYPLLMRADRVAGHILRALKQKKRVVVIDRRYALLVFFWRMIPRWLWERLPIKSKG